jgi:AFG3 family protein
MDKQPTQRPDSNPTNPFAKSWWIYLVIVVFIAGQWWLLSGVGPQQTNWQEVESQMIVSGDLEKLVVINQERVEIYLREEALTKEPHQKVAENTLGPQYYFNIGSVEVFEQKLQAALTATDVPPPILLYEKRSNWMADALGWLLPLAIILVLWVFLLRRMNPRGTGGVNPMDFGKSRAQLFDKLNRSQVTFDDVAGLEEAKVEIQEIVEFLKEPDRYTRLGAKIPKGVILVGPPGTGKTLMAKAVAGEAQVPFFSISGSEFVEMFVGVGASRVRDLFEKAKEKAPAIIFIDEIDAIGRSRGKAASLQSNDERESTLNQLLTEMDGFDGNTGVIVMAATNRADVLDRALIRPGRFDRHIYLELPNLTERKAIFQVHLRPLKLDQDIKVEILAAQTPGFSGADIANICNEAALIAARREKEAIGMDDFMEATDRIIAGLEKKSKIISESEKQIIAYHEAGHATVSWFLPHADTLMKVSIVPRGKSLGAAWYLPEEHQIYTRDQFLDRICAALGGRAAEDLIFGEISSGALDDLEKVTKQAYTMVAYYGLDEKIGNISYYDSTGEYSQGLQRPYSEATAQLIDGQVHQLVEQAYQRTLEVLRAHRAELESLAQHLIQQEVAYKEDLLNIFGERPKAIPKPIIPENQP